MKFSSSTVAAFLTWSALTSAPFSDAFAPVSHHLHPTTAAATVTWNTALFSTTEDTQKSMSKKKEDRLAFMEVEQVIEEQFQAPLVNELKSSNYFIENKDAGVKVYLAKDFGFCWGVERSIALAYEAVKHYPDRTLHITNELIHNPEVNDRLTEMKVNLIEKVGENQKDFSSIKEGDVVILPAFGASYEEMEMLDKKVSFRRKSLTFCRVRRSFWKMV
jgi:4-hydroxy-3-methylbut-2-enyl diphosphate reductase